MYAMMSLTSYLAAIAATVIFWAGVAQELLVARIAAAVIATAGIWFAESAERRTRSRGATQAATLNGLLLFAMAVVSLYLHFVE